MTTKLNLTKSDNNIEALEKTFFPKTLFQKKYSKSRKIMGKARGDFSNKFRKKALFEGEIPLCGVASGMLVPFMTMHEAYLLNNLLIENKGIKKIMSINSNKILAEGCKLTGLYNHYLVILLLLI